MSRLLRESPPLDENEHIIRSAAASRQDMNHVRVIGGRIYLTNHRLIHMPGLADRTLRGQSWEQRLSDIQSIDIGSRFRTFIGGFGQSLKVTTKQGEEASFQVWKGQALAAAIREAMAKDMS